MPSGFLIYFPHSSVKLCLMAMRYYSNFYRKEVIFYLIISPCITHQIEASNGSAFSDNVKIFY